MEKSTENNENDRFLKEGGNHRPSQMHGDFLGTTVPEGYFTQSKISILEKVKHQSQEKKKPKIFWMQPAIRYGVAASLVFALSITLWLEKVNNSDRIDKNALELLSFSDDVLVNSLFIDEADLDDFTKRTLINEVVLQAELSEQHLEDILINSLFIEDSLLDSYTSDRLLETIIL
jgi:hypothetical protein